MHVFWICLAAAQYVRKFSLSAMNSCKSCKIFSVCFNWDQERQQITPGRALHACILFPMLESFTFFLNVFLYCRRQTTNSCKNSQVINSPTSCNSRMSCHCSYNFHFYVVSQNWRQTTSRIASLLNSFLTLSLETQMASTNIKDHFSWFFSAYRHIIVHTRWFGLGSTVPSTNLVWHSAPSPKSLRKTLNIIGPSSGHGGRPPAAR